MKWLWRIRTIEWAMSRLPYVVIGFVLGALYMAPAHAQAETTLFSHATSSSASSFTFADDAYLHIASTTLQYYEAQGKRLSFALLQTGNSGCSSNTFRWIQNGVVIATSSDASYMTSCQNSTPRHAISIPEYDSRYNLTLENYIGTLTNGLKQYRNGPTYSAQPQFTFRNDSSGQPGNVVIGGYTWISDIATSTGGGATTTLFYPLGLNAIIDDMNCLNSATGTDCTFVYADPVSYITPGNMIAWLAVFLIAFFATFFLIRKLSN